MSNKESIMIKEFIENEINKIIKPFRCTIRYANDKPNFILEVEFPLAKKLKEFGNPTTYTSNDITKATLLIAKFRFLFQIFVKILHVRIENKLLPKISAKEIEERLATFLSDNREAK